MDWKHPGAILAAALVAASVAHADGPTGYAGVPASVLPHCLSRNPDRLALTPEQQARIDRILDTDPEGPARRAAIIEVLSETQRMIYRDSAGIAAC
jgi:hypothetical protein